jgi:phospholipid/cholesterol/gamma-HCH transport system ATP-binding protein
MIEFVTVHKAFGKKRVLDGVSFDIRNGEVFFIIGTSGAGKSVLLKHVIGLLQPDAGQVKVDGVDVTQLGERQLGPVRKKCAMVFQHSTLFDSMSCAENVALPLAKHGNLTQEAALERARELLEEVGVAEFGSRMPSDLGDGLKKQVAVARALALSPDYILFDEPTTSLDPVSGRRIDRLIRKLSDSRGVTCIVVSHDLRSIFTIADRIAMLYKGQVRILGTPEELRVAADPIVRQFVEGRSEGPLET